jgi:predicted PurR-regulated permease PerM
MKSSIISIGSILVVILLIVSPIMYPLIKQNEPITNMEIRFAYIITVLLFTCLIFAVLRLYNAIVSNTSYLMRVTKQLDTFNKGLGSVVQSFTKLSQSLGHSVGHLQSNVDNLTSQIQDFLTKIRTR